MQRIFPAVQPEGDAMKAKCAGKRTAVTNKEPRSKKGAKTKTINITELSVGDLLRITTAHSVCWLAVVDPQKLEVAMSRNGGLVANDPLMCILEGASVGNSFGFRLAHPKRIAVGFCISLKPKNGNGSRVRTEQAQKVALVSRPAHARRIVAKAMAASTERLR